MNNTRSTNYTPARLKTIVAEQEMLLCSDAAESALQRASGCLANIVTRRRRCWHSTGPRTVNFTRMRPPGCCVRGLPNSTS